jgi:hypothetical protein
MDSVKCEASSTFRTKKKRDYVKDEINRGCLRTGRLGEYLDLSRMN